jgi:hypothetical protein
MDRLDVKVMFVVEQDINEVCTILPMISIQCQNNPVIKQYRKENADIESLHFLSGEMLFESITLAKNTALNIKTLLFKKATLTGYQMA